MRHILKCKLCGEYTMEEQCDCGGQALPIKPPKYSPDDKYASYRREARKEELKKKGLI